MNVDELSQTLASNPSLLTSSELKSKLEETTSFSIHELKRKGFNRG